VDKREGVSMPRKKKNKKYKLKTYKATAKRFARPVAVRSCAPKAIRATCVAADQNAPSANTKWMQEVKSSSYKRKIKKLAPYLKR
jgi:hypothetical protein